MSFSKDDARLAAQLASHARALHAEGALSARLLSFALDMCADAGKVAAWRPLVWTYAIDAGGADAAPEAVAAAEREQFAQALRDGCTAEARARWHALALLDRFPVDVAKRLSESERAQRNDLEARQAPAAAPDPHAPGLHAASNDALVYGEVDVASFAEIFANYLPNLPASGGLFVDLGSGTGRAVFAAWLLHDFERCVGVELLRSLYDISANTLAEYRQQQQEQQHGQQQRAPVRASPASAASAAAAAAPASSKKGKASSHHASAAAGVEMELDSRPALAFQRLALDASRVEFTLGDLRRFDWSRADCVFCAATCFDGPLLQHIADEAARLRSGAYLISLSEALKGPHLRLAHSIVYRMSWGRATVHIHERV